MINAIKPSQSVWNLGSVIKPLIHTDRSLLFVRQKSRDAIFCLCVIRLRHVRSSCPVISHASVVFTVIMTALSRSNTSASYLDDVQQLTTRRSFICVLRKRGSIYTDDFVNGKCRGSVNEPTLKTKNKTIFKSKLKIRKLAITMRILVWEMYLITRTCFLVRPIDRTILIFLHCS